MQFNKINKPGHNYYKLLEFLEVSKQSDRFLTYCPGIVDVIDMIWGAQYQDYETAKAKLRSEFLSFQLKNVKYGVNRNFFNFHASMGAESFAQLAIEAKALKQAHGSEGTLAKLLTQKEKTKKQHIKSFSELREVVCEIQATRPENPQEFFEQLDEKLESLGYPYHGLQNLYKKEYALPSNLPVQKHYNGLAEGIWGSKEETTEEFFQRMKNNAHLNTGPRLSPSLSQIDPLIQKLDADNITMVDFRKTLDDLGIEVLDRVFLSSLINSVIRDDNPKEMISRVKAVSSHVKDLSAPEIKSLFNDEARFSQELGFSTEEAIFTYGTYTDEEKIAKEVADLKKGRETTIRQHEKFKTLEEVCQFAETHPDIYGRGESFISDNKIHCGNICSLLNINKSSSFLDLDLSLIDDFVTQNRGFQVTGIQDYPKGVDHDDFNTFVSKVRERVNAKCEELDSAARQTEKQETQLSEFETRKTDFLKDHPKKPEGDILAYIKASSLIGPWVALLNLAQEEGIISESNPIQGSKDLAEILWKD